MPVAIHRPSADNQKQLEGGKGYTSRKSLKEDNIINSFDCELSASNWRLNRGYPVVTLFQLEPSAHVRISFPVQCLDQPNEYRDAGQINMDGLHLVSAPPHNIFNVSQHQHQHFDDNYSSRNFRPAHLQHRSRHSNTPCQSSINSSVLILKESGTVKPGDHRLIDGEKKSSRKKGRKRVKQNKKLASSDSGSTEVDHGDGLRLMLSAEGSSLFQSNSNMQIIDLSSYTDEDEDEDEDEEEEEDMSIVNLPGQVAKRSGKQRSCSSTHSRTGKENSVWQKVQRNDAHHSNYKLNNKVNMLTKTQVKKDKVPRKSKRKTSPRHSPPNKASLEMNVQMKEPNYQKGPTRSCPSSASFCQANSSMKNGRSETSKSSNPVFLPHLFFQRLAQTGKESSCTDQSKPTHSMQKWIPVGTKDCKLTKPQNGDEDKVPKPQNGDEEIQTLKEKINNNVVGESEDKYSSDIDLGKITRAVNDACRMHMASKVLHKEIGYPIAEFEKLLHAAPPIISHETPNVSLGCVWQCYEKLGSYGLEVKAEDHGNSNRLGVDRFSFRAYYVPFLSAVQLFRSCKRNSTKPSENSPNSGQRSIFSILIPRPRSSNASGDTCGGKLSQSSNKQDLTFSDDPELVFEYFETDAPQLRRPLYEKIQELVRGEGCSEGKAYGDVSSLHSIKLDELEPNSWYAVSWYPIYKIPDGNLRTAFLTYHSLGHWSHKYEYSSMGECAVSPVVGLQSYNSQGECWFELRKCAMGESLKTSDILKERLRTLEGTACCMSRAIVKKGNQMSTNRHPDYEFFVSRRPR